MIKFKLYSIKSFKAPKSKVLDTGGNDAFMKGRKYDTDMDRLSRRSVQNELSSNGADDLNKEMNKAQKELRGFSMATTFILRRKKFGLIDVAGNAVDKTVDVTRNAVGGTVSGVGSTLDSGAGKAVGGVAGGLGALSVAGTPVVGTATAAGAATGAGIGAAVGSIVPVVGTAIGAGVGSVIGGATAGLGSAKLLYDAGSALGKSTAQAAGEGLKSVGNGIKAN